MKQSLDERTNLTINFGEQREGFRNGDIRGRIALKKNIPGNYTLTHSCLRFQANFTALHLAAQNGHNQSARVLLYAGCDSNAKNNVSFKHFFLNRNVFQIWFRFDYFSVQIFSIFPYYLAVVSKLL